MAENDNEKRLLVLYKKDKDGGEKEVGRFEHLQEVYYAIEKSGELGEAEFRIVRYR